MSEYGKYEAVIGLEVHVELKTETKIFCSCSTAFGADVNTHVCPTCLGMPGALPVLNKSAVRLACMAGMAFGSRINLVSWFDRKNYFYPDLPKGYQITQYEMPICAGGAVPVTADGQKREIRLTRMHLEEDAGKLTHRGDVSLIDYNRCGVPLLEIVSEPDMHTPEEAKAYLTSLRRILSYIGVSDCRMNEGSLRCDVNVSVRPCGAETFGVKCEIKNLNSINYVGRALEDEIARQISVLENGGEIESETRRYNEDTGHTERMRKKESVIDYRYFTEPNIPPLVLRQEDLDAVKRQMPKMPDEAARELTEVYGVKTDDAYMLTESPELTKYFVQCAENTAYKAIAANLFVSEILPALNAENTLEKNDEHISPEHFGAVCTLFGEGKVVSSNAKKLLFLCAQRKEEPAEIAEKERMLKITDEKILLPLVREAVENNPKAAADYRGGKKTAVKQLLGVVMKASAGSADPLLTERLLEDELRR
ncbi:MAG: Asp-tRNA(Asn)/Glu-tRNA(Gln) amidotransferase subunit GatB [Clostridia bacterium]|nr:Asp-tRNA(Asn)/Glu-tRNA(Gln) amidotransferase subunit GatB [Clostridia bacterium]